MRSRFSVPKAKAEASTPSVIKALKPDIPGAVLTYQVPTSTFQGYYPKAEVPAAKRGKAGSSYSTGRTVGDKWSAVQALTQVVNFLWAHHKKAGYESWLLGSLMSADRRSLRPSFSGVASHVAPKDCSEKPTIPQIRDALELGFKILAGEIPDPNPSKDDKNDPGVQGERGEPEREVQEEAEEEQPEESSGDLPDVSSPSSCTSSSSDSSSGSSPARPMSSKAKAKPKSERAAAKAKRKASKPPAKKRAKSKKESKKTSKKDKAKSKKDKKEQVKKTSHKGKAKAAPAEAKKRPQPLDTSNVVIPRHMRRLYSKTELKAPEKRKRG